LVQRDQIAVAGLQVLKSPRRVRPTIPLWDGGAANRMGQDLKGRAGALNS